MWVEVWVEVRVGPPRGLGSLFQGSYIRLLKGSVVDVGGFKPRTFWVAF